MKAEACKRIFLINGYDMENGVLKFLVMKNYAYVNKIYYANQNANQNS